MTKVLKVDCSTGGGSITKNFGVNETEVWVYADVALDATALTNLLSNPGSFTDFDLIQLAANGGTPNSGAEWYVDTGPTVKWAAYNGSGDPASTPFAASGVTSMQFYRVKIHLIAGSPIAQNIWIDGSSIGTITVTGANMANVRVLDLFQPGLTAGNIYFDNIKVGTTDGDTDIFSDDFEGGDTSHWTTVDAVFTVVDDPGIAAVGPQDPNVGRVLIAFNDGPLAPNPAFTAIDQGGSFPDNFVAEYEMQNGRQSLVSQTDTGTATVTLNDRDGLFDPRNTSSPYFGLLDGKQILLQIYNPILATWEPQFQGLIDDIGYVLDGSGANSDGDPVNTQIQLSCVDIFDYLAGYGLTPGLDGVYPTGGTKGAAPAGGEDAVYYAATSGTVDDRIIEVLTDVGVDSSRYIVASGNVKLLEGRYDPDEAALTVLRDCADAEFPFIANIYVDRSGNFVFRGRYSRIAPDGVAAEPGSEWDFTRWYAGDGKAIAADLTHHRAQMRVLEFNRARSNIINAVLCYPQGLKASDMPNQVFADATSIMDYGKHAAQPMSDLLVASGIQRVVGGSTYVANDGPTECQKYAELLVKNQKDPREAVSAIQFQSIDPSAASASATWDVLTRSDISHIVNVQVGYPGGTGFTGAATVDDYYIEGKQLTVTPANTGYDYVELDLDVSPAVWSMDTHGVLPPFS